MCVHELGGQTLIEDVFHAQSLHPLLNLDLNDSAGLGTPLASGVPSLPP